MSSFKKYSKVLVFSVVTLFLYIFIENSDKINATFILILESKSAWGFGYYILFKLAKLFLLVFGVVGLCFFSFKIFIKKD